MLKRLLAGVASYPPLWDLARRVIEFNHGAEKRAIRRELGEVDGAVLDVPCGTGLFAPLFPSSSYTGVDLSEANVVHARRKHGDRSFHVMSALALELDDASFDAVLVVGFLHHLKEPAVLQALDEIRRVLRPGGRFLLIEDSPTRGRWNVPGRLLQALDAGDDIRPSEWYSRVLGERFEIRRTYPLRAGLWDYSVFVLH